MISPKNLIADFYMYEFLVNSEPTIDNDLETEILYEANEFLKMLKEYLIEALEYSIIKEISHVWWETFNPYTMNPPTEDYLSTIIDEDIFYILLDLAPAWVDSLPVKAYMGETLKGSTRLGQYMFIKDHKDIDIAKFISKFKKYFVDIPWNNPFGGEKWLIIAETYLKLKESEGKELYTVCDTIFWLQHNTNTVFNKIKSWEIDGSYDWINEFLDFRKECDLWELWDYCRASKKIAGKKLSKVLDKTKEESMSKISDLPKLELDDIEEEVFTIVATKDEYSYGTSLEEISEFTIGKIEPIFKSFDNMKKAVENLPDELADVKADLHKYIGVLHEDIVSEMTKFKKETLYEVKIIKEEVEKYIDGKMQTIDKSLQLSENILLDFIQTQHNISTNAILEKLEQRWYKKLFKFFKNLFIKN
jgi:hypothetical protein